jgi:hypothetical protein
MLDQAGIEAALVALTDVPNVGAAGGNVTVALFLLSACCGCRARMAAGVTRRRQSGARRASRNPDFRAQPVGGSTSRT